MFVSTISAGGRSESDLLSADDALAMGPYVVSKWVAEHLVRRAMAKGLPACIVRPEMITGSTTTGYSSASQFVGRLIRGFAELKHSIQEPMAMGMLPVDYVAHTMICIARSSAANGKIYNVANGDVVSYPLLAEAVQACGYPVTSLPYTDWRRLLMERLAITPSLEPLLPFFADTPDLTVYSYDCSGFLQALTESGHPELTTAPIMTPELLRRYAQHLLTAVEEH